MGRQSLITRGELSLALEASARVSERAAVPDVLHLADLRSAPQLSTDLILRRLSDETTPREPARYLWPKDRGGVREMTYLDPYDEVLYRAMVGRFLRQIEAQLDRPRVLAAIPKSGRPFWRLEPHGPAIKLRSDFATGWLDEADVHIMLTLDVKEFFPSVALPVLARSLAALPGPETTKLAIVTWLKRTTAQTNISGLPIGPEPSAVLANHLLRTADLALAGWPHWVRYMDDTWIFAVSQQIAFDLGTEYEARLRPLRLGLNDEKCQFHGEGDAREVVRSSLLDYMDEELRTVSGEAEAEVAALFDYALEDPRERKRELRRSLSVLTKRGNTHAVRAIRDNPNLIGVAPDHWKRYLKRLAETKRGKRALDPDWLASSVLDPKSDYPDAERLMLLPALSTMQAEKATGRKLFDLSLDATVPAPIRIESAVCWGRAKGWKRNVAIEAAREAPDFGTRRALASTLTNVRGDPVMARAASDLARAEPELEPIARWLVA